MDAVSLHYWMHLRTLLSTFHTTGTYIALRLTPARAMSKRSFDEVLKNADQKSATAKGRAKKAKKNVVMQFKTAIPASSSSSSSSSSAIAIKSIASVNVSGFRACQNRSEKKPRILEDYLADEQPEVVILQETKAYYSEVGEAMDFKAHGYPYVYWNPSTGKKGYSGTAILSKVPPVAEPVFGINDPSDEEGRVITAEFAEFYLVNSYTRNKGQNLKFTTERDSFDANMTAHLAALKETAEGKGKYVIYGGDLNVAHLDIDVYDGTTNKQRKKSAGFTPEERATFSNLLEDGWVDTFRHLHGNERVQFTFYGRRANANGSGQPVRGWRLDYFLVNQQAIEKVKGFTVRTDFAHTFTDHVPVVLQLH